MALLGGVYLGNDDLVWLDVSCFMTHLQLLQEYLFWLRKIKQRRMLGYSCVIILGLNLFMDFQPSI